MRAVAVFPIRQSRVVSGESRDRLAGAGISPARAAGRLDIGGRGMYPLLMRRIRHLAAVATYLLMIQLVILSGTLACPMAAAGSASMTPMTMSATMGADARSSHDAADASARGSMSEDASSHSAGRHGEHRHAHHPGGSHCHLPCTPSGCASTGHCASTVLDRSHTPVVLTRDVAGRATRAHADAPHSVSTAPEPPPPRA